jgi:hypothetical protein
LVEKDQQPIFPGFSEGVLMWKFPVFAESIAEPIRLGASDNSMIRVFCIPTTDVAAVANLEFPTEFVCFSRQTNGILKEEEIYSPKERRKFKNILRKPF